MTQPNIACQTITFGEEQSQHFPAVLKSVADAGYAGVEIGYRHVARVAPAVLRQHLADTGLELVASHVGGNLEDASQASGERQMLDAVIDFLHQMQCGVLMYSGLQWKEADQFARDLAMLNRSAQRCAQAGVRLLYHNHNWEFQNGARAMEGLIGGACDELGLCPDLGWIHKGGADVTGFLERNRGRLGAIHFKDFATMNPVTDTVVLGAGIAPLREAMLWLRQHCPDLWMIAEQDTCAGEPAEAVAANAAFLRKAWDHANTSNGGRPE